MAPSPITSARLFAGSALVALLAVWSLAGCGAQSGSPHKTADAMTRAVYANDYDKFTSYFDDATKSTVTRADVGALSDKMRALGDVQTIAQHDADPDKGRYTYDVTFSHGSLLVELRVDPTGKVGAYRVIPQGSK